METHMGVPQGGIISPLLSNLILNELDNFVGDLISEYTSTSENGSQMIINPAYTKLTGRISRLSKKIETKVNDSDLKKQKITLIKERRRLPNRIPAPGFVKMDYVRYADDWIIGV